MLMRDDCYMCSFRMSSFKLKTLILLFILLLLVCASSLYGTWHYYGRYKFAAEERRNLQLEINEARPLLDELATIKQNSDHDSQFVAVNTFHSERDETGASPAGEGNEAASVPGPDEVRRMLGQETAPTEQLAAQATTQNDPGNASGNTAAPQEHPIKIQDFKANLGDRGQISFSFALTNQKSNLLLQGRCGVSVLTKDGKSYSVISPDEQRLNFSIRSMKMMKDRFTLPENVLPEDVVKILVQADAQKQERYEASFPVSFN